MLFVVISTEAFYLHLCITSLEKESQDFPSCVFSSCFFMVHDARWGCQYNETKLMRWKQVVLPFFSIFELHIKSGADYSTLVQPASEVYNNFPSSVVINNFKFANVAMLHLHQAMTLEHGLIRTWHLPLFSALLILLRASARTFMHTIMATRKDGGKSPSISF